MSRHYLKRDLRWRYTRLYRRHYFGDDVSDFAFIERNGANPKVWDCTPRTVSA